MAASFENILLEAEQKRLLIALVEATRKQPRDRRHKFAVIQAYDFVVIVGLDKYPDAYLGDIEELANTGMLSTTYTRKGSLQFDVSPLGFQYYEFLMRDRVAPTEQIEKKITSYLDSIAFEKRHPEAYAKWMQAEELLWGSDSQDQHTAIGHHCREAMQYFATSIVEQFQPPNVEQNPDQTIRRLAAVLQHTSDRVSDSVTDILQAMLNYWAKLNTLAQRQEHGAQKEGETLTWEDSRRLVFQTANVMFEVDRTLQDLK